jgi:adenylylsulfate reductase subunit A
MATVSGLFCAGDASGASSHKFSSGSHAEGRIAAKAAVRYCVENPEEPHVSEAQVTALKEEILQPLDNFDRHKDKTTDVDLNPNYIRPKSFLFRLQKIMDEYAGGVSAQFTTNRQLLEKGMELLGFLKEDASKLAARDLHELMRCWENVHRMWQAEAHTRTLMFREETRWPGYYYRADTPSMDDENWKCFANCRWVPSTGEWEMIKRPIIPIFSEVREHELLGG